MLEQNPLCTSPNDESGPLANNGPLTGYETNFFDDFHFSETTAIFLQESSSDTRPSYLHDAEISDDTIGRALSSPLLTQEREEPAGRRQAYHSLEESLLPSQSLSVNHVRTCRPVNELSSLNSSVRENPSRDSENEKIRILLERQEEQILADCGAEIQKHEFQTDDDRRGIPKLNGIIESQRREINRALAGDERRRQDQQLLHEQLLEQNWELHEAHEKNINEMEELKRFQGSTFAVFSKKKLIEDRDTILEHAGKIQELQNEVTNCVTDSRDFKDAESGTQWTIPRCQSTSVFPTFSRSWRNAEPFSGNAEPQRQAVKYFGHACFFANPTASSSTPCPQESNPWVPDAAEHTSPHVMSESQTPDLDQRCQSGPSARNSSVPSEGRFSKNYGADQLRLQISDPHFDKLTTPATFACWKIRFKTEVCICSQFPTEAMLWIKEVEMVLNQWKISNLRVQQEVFKCQILKCSMRRLLQH